MESFNIQSNTTKQNTNKRLELIKQIESLQRFYYDIGYDTSNIKTIFSLTLSYLKGQVNKLIVKSFFEVLISQNKLCLNKEINLLNCFDELIDELDSKNDFANTVALPIKESKQQEFEINHKAA